MIYSRSQRLYAMGFLLAASAGLVISLFLPWRHHEVPAGSGLPPDPGSTIIPMTFSGSLGQLLLTYVLVAAFVFALCAAGQYIVHSGVLRVLLIIVAGVAIVYVVALLLFAWVVMSLLDDTGYISRMDVGFLLSVVSLCSACVGWLLTVFGKRRLEQAT